MVDDKRPDRKPEVVCMCGSTRFQTTWVTENARLTEAGCIVLSVGLWGHHDEIHGLGRYPSPERKAKLDELHKRKIDLCNWVWVLDVNGYIGDSTRSEIEYAQRVGRPIRYLSKEFSGFVEPADPIIEQRDCFRAELKAAREVVTLHNLLPFIAKGECRCDASVGMAPCETCAAHEILTKSGALMQEGK